MKATILVVDDENVTLRIVRHALASIDVEAVDAADGMQAVQLASQSQFDMAIVDINLPDMDGFEVVRRLKSFNHLRDVPVVMFTARHTRDDELLAAEVGAQGFFYKPFSTQELRDMVRQHLDG